MIIRNRFRAAGKVALSVLPVLAALALFTLAAGRIAGGSDTEGLRLTTESVRRAAVQCYALEGAYPPDLEHLKAHYGLRPDERKYAVFYTYVGANLMPDVTVLFVGAAEAPGGASGSE